MKIIKSFQGAQEIFDTDNIERIEYPKTKTKNIVPLNQTHAHALTDFEFLSKFFPVDHAIFSNFSSAYYYGLEIATVIE